MSATRTHTCFETTLEETRVLYFENFWSKERTGKGPQTQAVLSRPEKIEILSRDKTWEGVLLHGRGQNRADKALLPK